MCAEARMEAATNPDIDMDFYDFYKNTCGEIADLIHTNNPVYILGGEGFSVWRQHAPP